MINNKNPDPAVHDFNSLPDGLSNIRTFMGRNRNHIFYEDLDGDCIKEVISELNGYWNRIQVWDAEGKGKDSKGKTGFFNSRHFVREANFLLKLISEFPHLFD